MMKFFSRISLLYHWWIEALLSCLPESISEKLIDLHNDVELIIAYQDNTIFIQTVKGKIIDSLSLDNAASADNNKDSAMTSVAEEIGEYDELETILLDQQAGATSDGTLIDFDISATDAEDDVTERINSIDFVFDTQKDSESFAGEKTEDSNVIPLNIPREDEITVILDNGDQTTRLMDLNEESDEDTLVIKNDQGNVVQGDTQFTVEKESTILFCNDGGKIRQIDSSEVESLGQHQQVVSEDITELVSDFDSQESELGYDKVALLLKKYQGNKKCLYLLPDNKFFILNLMYPIEAVLNIENVLKYDLEKHIPLTFDEVRYFYAINVDSVKEQVHVEVAVIKAVDYDALKLILAPYLGDKLICSTQGFYHKYGSKINFLEDQSTKDWRSFIEFKNLHIALNWALILILLLFPIYQLQYQINQISESDPSELNRVKSILGSVRTLNDDIKFGSSLVNNVNRFPRAVELLNSLSTSIDKQAWISRLSLRGNEVKLKGEAVSATRVSDDLNRTNLFESIKFVSSIVKNPRTGKETFELVLVLKSDA